MLLNYLQYLFTHCPEIKNKNEYKNIGR